MKTNETTTREQALAWWNSLSVTKKRIISYEHWFPRLDTSLTGREIEEIWRKETAHIDPSDIEAAYKMQVKPNQKQFKEGNDDLFKAYINKFSQEYKARMLQILIDDLGVRYLVDESLRSIE